MIILIFNVLLYTRNIILLGTYRISFVVTSCIQTLCFCQRLYYILYITVKFHITLIDYRLVKY